MSASTFLTVALAVFLNFSGEVEARVHRAPRQGPQATVANLDIASACRTTVRYEADTKTDKAPNYSACVSDEQDARSELQKVWSSFSANMREQCLSQVTPPALPSYSTLLSCLNMARDAVKMIEADQANQTAPNRNLFDLRSLR
jgi:hypothetical protein